MIFDLILLFSVIGKIRSSCSGCSFCPYNTYNINYNNENYSDLSCVQKTIVDNLTRNVLIIPENSSIPSDYSFFSFFYTSMETAFLNETFLCSQAFFCNLTIFFLNQKYDFDNTFNSYSKEYFRRIRGYVSLELIWCTTFEIPGCVNSSLDSTNNTINITNFDHVFYVSDFFSVRGLNFNGNFPDFQIKSDFSQSGGFFELEPILDDMNNPSLPQLILQNVKFKFFDSFKFRNRQMKNLIRCLSYGIFFIDSLDVTESFFSDGLFFYQNQSSSSFISNNQTFIISISNSSITNSCQNNSFIYTNNFLFLIQEWNGLLMIENLNIINITTNSYFFVFNFIHIENQINVRNLSMNMMNGPNIYYLIQSSLKNDNLTVRNSKFSATAIRIDSLSYLNISKFQIHYCFVTESSIFFLESSGNFSISDFLFQNLTNFMFAFSYSNLEIFNGSLINTDSSRIFIFDSSQIKLDSLCVQDTTIQISIFLFYDSPNLLISAIALINIIGSSTIIEIQNLNNAEFDDFLMKNVTCPYFFSPSPLIKVLTLKKAYFEDISFYRIFYIPSYVVLYFEDFYIGNLYALYWNNLRSYIFQFMHTTLLTMNRIFFENNFGDVNPFAMYHLSVGTVHVSNSSFINIGWRNNDTSPFYSVDDNAVLYFFNEIYVTVDNCNFLSFNVSLHGGFIVYTGGAGIFTLTNSFFKHYITPYNYAMGVVIFGAKNATLINNTFESLVCPISKMRFSYFQHRNGPVALLGEASIAKKSNSRVFVSISNSFRNCQCANGGSLTVLNFNSTILRNCTFYNSTGLQNGGVFAIYSATLVILENVMTNLSQSLFGSVGIIFNIDNALVTHCKFTNAFAKLSGSIEVRNTKIIEINSCLGRNLTTLGKGGFLMLSAYTLIVKNLSLFEINSQEGAFSIIDSGSLLLYNSSFLNCVSLISGAIVSVDLGKNILIDNVTILNVHSNENGAAIILRIIENFEANNILIANSSTLRAGMIYLKCPEESSVHFLRNLTCLGNNGEQGSCVYFESSSFLDIYMLNITYCYGKPLVFSYPFSTYITLQNIYLYRNYIYESAFKMENIQASIFIILMIENMFVSKVKNLFLIYQSTNFSLNCLMIINGEQKQNEFIQIYSLENSNLYSKDLFLMFDDSSINTTNNYFTILQTYKICLVTMYNSIFQGVYFETSSKGLINIDSNFLNISLCYFYKNMGPILSLTNSNFSLQNSIFQDTINSSESTPNELYVDNNNNQAAFVSIISCKIQSLLGMTAQIQNNFKIHLFHSLFESDKNTLSSNAFIISEISELFIEKCLFENFNFSLGSIIYIENTIHYFADIQIKNSEFSNGISFTGGAIYILGDCNILINNSIFNNNRAIFNKNTIISGVAGVLYFESLTSSSLNSLTVMNNSFENNSADIAINEIYSSVCLTLENNLFLYSNEDFNSKNLSYFSFYLKTSLYESPDLYSIKSGSLFSFSFKIMDCHDQILNFESESIGNVNLISLNQTPATIKSGVAKADQGIFNFSNVRVYADANVVSKLTITLNLYNQITRKINKLQNSIFLKTIQCSEGEIVLTDKSCFLCSVGTYSSNYFPNETPNQCLKCPENAYCVNGTKIIPESGYWRASNESRLILQCNVPNSCLGVELNSNITQNPDTMDITGACKLKQYGNLCDLCDSGFGKYEASSTCEECQSLQMSTIVRAFIILVFICIFVIHSSKSVKQNMFIIEVCTVLINYTQRLSIIVFSELVISTNDIKSYLNYFAFFNILSTDVYTNDCFLDKVFGSAQKKSFYKILFSLLLPFLLSAFCVLVFIILNLRMFLRLTFNKNKLKNNNDLDLKTYFLKKGILFFLICSFICYGMLIQSFVSIIDCIYIDDISSARFVATSPNFECWTGLHLYAATPVSVFGIFLWGFFFPLFIWKLMGMAITGQSFNSIYSNVSRLKSSNSIPKNTIITNPKILDEATFQFFNKSFRREYYYWQCAIFVQKLLITLFAKLRAWTGYQPFQLLNLVLLMFSLYFTDKLEPFKRKNINQLEMFSLFTTFICNLSIVCLVTSTPTIWKFLFYVLIGIFNVLFFAFAIYLVLRYTEWKNFLISTKSRVNNLASTFVRGSLSKGLAGIKVSNKPRLFNNFRTIIVQNKIVNRVTE